MGCGLLKTLTPIGPILRAWSCPLRMALIIALSLCPAGQCSSPQPTPMLGPAPHTSNFFFFLFQTYSPFSRQVLSSGPSTARPSSNNELRLINSYQRQQHLAKNNNNDNNNDKNNNYNNININNINNNNVNKRHYMQSSSSSKSLLSPSSSSSRLLFVPTTVLLARAPHKKPRDGDRRHQNPSVGPKLQKRSFRFTQPVQQEEKEETNDKRLETTTINPNNNPINNNPYDELRSVVNKTHDQDVRLLEEDNRKSSQDADNDLLLVQKFHPRLATASNDEEVPISRQTQVLTLQHQMITAGCPPLNDTYTSGGNNSDSSCRTCLCDEDIIASSLTTTTTSGPSTTKSPTSPSHETAGEPGPNERSSAARGVPSLLYSAITSTANNNESHNRGSLSDDGSDYRQVLTRSPPRCTWVPCINLTFATNDSLSGPTKKAAFKVGKCLIAVACVIAFLSIFGLFLSVHRFCERRGHFQLASSDEDIY